MRGTCYHLFYISPSLFFLSPFHFTENPPELRYTRRTIRRYLQRYPFTSPSLSISVYIVAYVFVFLLNFIYIFFFFGFGVEDLCEFDKSDMNYELSLLDFVDLMN